MKKQQKYWFAAKRYGWGWGLPLTWQGWLAYVFGLGGFLLGVISGTEMFETDKLIGLGLIGIGVVCQVVLLVICLQKGEPARWRWGDKK